MIIIGHAWVPSPKFFKVSSIDDIKKSLPTDIILLEPLSASHQLAKYCSKNHIAFAVSTQTVEEAIFANAMGAKYIICNEEYARIIHSIAQEYLFDTRLLVPINDDKEIPKIAQLSIDGVIFPSAIY